MRVVLIASAPPPALELSSSLADLGHELAALISFRGPEALRLRLSIGAACGGSRLVSEALARVMAGDPGDAQDEAEAS
jgi:hypothetical protein